MSTNGTVAALTCRFYAGYLLAGAKVTITWNHTTLTITDNNGQIIKIYPRPTRTGERHGPRMT